MVVRRSLRIASSVTPHSLLSYSAQTSGRIPLCNVLSKSLTTTRARTAQGSPSQQTTSTQNEGTTSADDTIPARTPSQRTSSTSGTKDSLGQSTGGQSIQPNPSTSQPLKTALSSQTNGTSKDDLLSKALDGLGGTGRGPRRGPRTSERPPPAQARPAPAAKLTFKDDLSNMISAMRNQASRNVVTPNDRSSRGGVNTSQMKFPPSSSDMRPYAGPFDPLSTLMTGPRTAGALIDTEPPKMRMNPSLGRTVDVDADRNMDLARAFQTLNIKCSINRVKQDFNKQRFHERPGLKRKRLATERWRKRFKESFRATVRRVQDMRRKGW